MQLFTTPEPLAARMRPRTLREFIGQEHILGPGRLLRRAIEADQLSSLIFYGPPGTGKTTLAMVIANTTRSHFITINAVVKIVVGLPFGLLERLWSGFSIIEGTLTGLVLHLTAAAFFAIAVFVFYKFLPNRKIDAIQVLPAAILVGIAGEIMKDIYVFLLPWMDIRDNQGSQGPFFMSVSFVLLGYFETFVVLGGAFLATHTEHYPWMGFIPSRRSEESGKAEESDKAIPTIT